MFTSFYSKLLGIDSELVKRQPNASRLKILTLGQLLLIPVLLWSLSGFLMTYNLIGAKWYFAALVGILCAGMIYIVDRSFVTAYGNDKEKLMKRLRFVFAILSGILGAIAIDTTIFEGDIDDYQKKKASTISNNQKDEYFDKHSHEIDQALSERDRAHTDFRTAQDAFIAEMNGDGTGFVGYGPVAKQKEQEAERAEMHFQKKDAELKALKEKLTEEAEFIASTQAAIGSKTVMKKIHDFHEFVFSSGWNIGFYIIFFLVIMLAEIMLILYKSGAAKTALDEAIMEEEMASKQRLLALRRQRDKYEQACAELGDREVHEIFKLSARRA